MNSILTLLKLDIRTRFGFGRKITKNTITSAVINLIFTVLIYAVYIVGLLFITDIMVTGSVPLRYEFLVLASGISMLVQTVICTGILVKSLYYDGNNELLLRFPVDGRQIFVAKAIFAFLFNLVIAFGFTIPIYVIYGVKTGASAGFYALSFFMIPIMTILPYSLANLIALPVINLTNFLKNRFALILALTIIIVVSGFAFYMLVLKGVLEYASNKSPGLLTEDIRGQIGRTVAGLAPFNLYGNVLYGKNGWLSMLLITVISAAFAVTAYFVSKKTVYRIVLNSIEREAEAFEYKTTEKVRRPFTALLRKEYLLIFRSLNYSFQYLAMAITAPVMVFFCNDLASSIGDAGVGGRIIPGLTMLVVLIFVTIIVSFASTAISREGDTFYLTKIMPISYKFQILVKLTLYFVVATASVLVSCIIVGAAFGGKRYGYNVMFADIASIFTIAEMVILAVSASAIRSDLKSPTFNVSKNGELVEANKNVSANMMLGCAVAVLFGVFTMIFSYVPLHINGVTLIRDTKDAYVFLLIISAIMAAAELLLLFRKLDSKYNKIKSE